MDPLPRTGLRRELLRNRFFAVHEEEVEDRHGRPYPYLSIDCTHDAVVVVPVLPGRRLLVERIYRHPCRRWFHEFPAGAIEPGEDPCAAGARELAEETGHTARTVRPLHAFEVMPGLLRMRLHLVLASGLRPGAPVSHEAMELIRLEQLPEAEAWRLAGVDGASSFLTLGLLALARSRARRRAGSATGAGGRAPARTRPRRNR